MPFGGLRVAVVSGQFFQRQTDLHDFTAASSGRAAIRHGVLDQMNHVVERDLAFPPRR